MKGPNPIQFASKRRIALFSGGLLLMILFFVIFQTRVELFSTLRSVFVWVLLLSLGGFICRTFAWAVSLGKLPRALLKMKLGGDALNQLASMVPLRGDTLNLVLLKKRHDIKDAVDSLVRDRGIGLLSIYLAAWLFPAGALLSNDLFPLPVRTSLGVLWLLGGLLPFALTRSRGFFSSILARLPVSPALRGRYEETDRIVCHFFQESRGRFITSLLFYLLAQGFLVAEVWWIGTVLGFGLSPALMLGGLIPLLYKALSFIPNAMGVLEAVVGGLLVLLLGPGGWSTGIGLQTVRRIKGLFWFLLGLGLVGNPSKAMS